MSTSEIRRVRLETLDMQDGLRNEPQTNAPTMFVGTVVGSPGTTVPAYFKVKPQSIKGTPTEGGTATFADGIGTPLVYVLGPSVPTLGQRLTCWRAGGGWVAETCCGGPTCGQICVLVQDLCGPQPSFIQYIKACDYWIDTGHQTITDANGVWPWVTAQSWVSAANATALIPFNSTNIWDPTPFFESVLWCSACGGAQLLTVGATGTDDRAALTLSWNATLGYFQSQDLFWSPGGSYYSDSISGLCMNGGGASVKYFYRIYCDGDNLRCELWTYPVSSCSLGGDFCGYYLGDFTTGVPPTLVKLLTVTVSPTCDDDSMDASFTFDSFDGGCIALVAPPAHTVTATFPKSHCRTLKSGIGAYGYFWTYQPTTVTLTMRVFADLCPGGMPWTVAMAADAAFLSPPNAPSGYFVDYVVAVKPTCAPNYSASFAFSKPATSHTALSIAGAGPGDPPHGTVTLPTTFAIMNAPEVATNYVFGAVATMVDQNGAAMGACTTDHSGTCCLPTPPPGQYWVTITKPDCDCPVEPQTQEINYCPPPCNESVSCSVCDGTDLAVKGATGRDNYVGLKFTYSYLLGLWQSQNTFWQPPASYFIDSVGHTCRDGSGAFAPYFYRVYCDGDNLKCELWSCPIQPCPYDDTVCGYYLGDDQYEDDPTLVLLATVSSAPVCDSSAVTASFTFDPLGGCEDPIAPPSVTVSVNLPQIEPHHVLCCGDHGLPIPRKNLTFSYSGTGGTGVETLVYTPNVFGAGWVSAHARFGCGAPVFFGQLLFQQPTYYTWVPLFMSWTVDGNTYTVSE